LATLIFATTYGAIAFRNVKGARFAHLADYAYRCGRYGLGCRGV